MSDDSPASSRRRFLQGGVIGALFGTSGCLRFAGAGGTETQTASATPEDDVQDSDDDGVIDSEDYAPRDPDVQREAQVKGDTPTASQSSPQSVTRTETATAAPNGGSTGTPSDGSGDRSVPVSYGFEDTDLSDWELRGQDSRNEVGIADAGQNSQHSLYLDHNGSINNFWVETTLDSVVSPTTISFWIQPTKSDSYSKDMFRLRNGDTDVIWFTNHRENDGVYFRFGSGNDEEDRRRIRDGAITTAVDGFVAVRMEEIDWGNGTIGTVYIDGEQTATDAPFLDTKPGFDSLAPYSVGGGNSAFRIDNIGWE